MRPIKQITKEKTQQLKEKIIFSLENIFDVYFSYHTRPKFSSDIHPRIDILKEYSKVAIIIQGPLLKKDKFTLHSIRIYNRIFKHYKIILSTWEDEDEEYLAEIRKENVEILLNKKPEYGGIGNINFQLISTFNAISHAKKLGVRYVLKTRTDLRIYSPNAIEFLVHLIKTFPINPAYKQNHRIAIPSLCTMKYRPYSITDLVMFGDIDDMVSYWGVPLDDRKICPIASPMGNWSKARLAEVYLSAYFLESLGRKLEWTIQDSWRMYAEHFCIFDNPSIDVLWCKYARVNEYRQLVYKNKNNLQEMTFGEWLNIYSNLDNIKDIPEGILDITDQYV